MRSLARNSAFNPLASAQTIPFDPIFTRGATVRSGATSCCNNSLSAGTSSVRRRGGGGTADGVQRQMKLISLRGGDQQYTEELPKASLEPLDRELTAEGSGPTQQSGLRTKRGFRIEDTPAKGLV